MTISRSVLFGLLLVAGAAQAADDRSALTCDAIAALVAEGTEERAVIERIKASTVAPDVPACLAGKSLPEPIVAAAREATPPAEGFGQDLLAVTGGDDWFDSEPSTGEPPHAPAPAEVELASPGTHGPYALPLTLALPLPAQGTRRTVLVRPAGSTSKADSDDTVHLEASASVIELTGEAEVEVVVKDSARDGEPVVVLAIDEGTGVTWTSGRRSGTR